MYSLTVYSWQRVWRFGFAPLMSDATLTALLEALDTDDQRLTQGSTTTPPPLMCVQDWPTEAACALGFCGAVQEGGFCTDHDGKKIKGKDKPGEGAASVGVVEEFFATACFKADQFLGEPAACRHFLNWFDSTARDTVRRELAAEIRGNLAERGVPAPVFAGSN